MLADIDVLMAEHEREGIEPPPSSFLKKGVTWNHILSDKLVGLNDIPVSCTGTLEDTLSLLVLVLK